jgi:hypothetical protein
VSTERNQLAEQATEHRFVAVRALGGWIFSGECKTEKYISQLATFHIMHKKGDETSFRNLPQRHLTESEKQYIALKIEKSRLSREQAQLVLDKGMILFFAFLVFAVIAVQNDMISRLIFNLLVIGSVCVLLLSVTPYLQTSKKVENEINKILHDLTK